jgi:transposase
VRVTTSAPAAAHLGLVRRLAPSLLALPGVAELTAAKITAQAADVRRLRSTDASARHNGTAPLPAWPGSQVRHRLARAGNRRLDCAIRRIAVTPMRCHPPAQAYLKARVAGGDTKTEALRALKRRLSGIVYRTLHLALSVTPRWRADETRCPVAAQAVTGPRQLTVGVPSSAPARCRLR